MTACRACSGRDTTIVLDLGCVPAADHFPPAATPVADDEASHRLRMMLCRTCGLAQLAEDDTHTAEPAGVEPEALRLQAAHAVDTVATDGWLTGATVTEFGSPHGGSWIPLLTGRGFVPAPNGYPADVVIDSFGIMHAPDQCAAMRERAQAVAAGGVLLLQFHSVRTIIDKCQWAALRHGHFAYYSLTVLSRLLDGVGMTVRAAWEFDLYGGTVLIAATHRERRSSSDDAAASVRHLMADEARTGTDAPRSFGRLQDAADRQTHQLRERLVERARRGERVYGYGAASRAVALFARAGIDRTMLRAVGDAAPAKHDRRMPGTDIPIVAPDMLVAQSPDHVLVTVPELVGELERTHPSLRGRCTAFAF